MARKTSKKSAKVAKKAAAKLVVAKPTLLACKVSQGNAPHSWGGGIQFRRLK